MQTGIITSSAAEDHARMSGLLRLTIPACPPIPLLGNYEIVGGCVALALEQVIDRMVPRRDHLAERNRLPPDPAAVPAEWSEGRKQDWLRHEAWQHKEYLRLSAAVAEAEDALRRGADLELSAVLFMHECSEIERWSGLPIVERRFVWAECRRCDRRYDPGGCGQSDWSRVTDPLAGIGGRCLTCPASHVIFAVQTWVA
jgi:hypothetical protein